MPMRLELFLTLLSIVFMIFIISRVKSKKLSLNYSLLWLFFGLVMIVCACSEPLLSHLANLLGIKEVSNMIFLFGFVLLITLTFSLTMIVSLQNKKITSLVQEVGILKKDLRGKKND